MEDRNAVVKIFRFDPSEDKKPRYEIYKVPYEAWNNRKIIDTLIYIYQNLAPGLAFRGPCSQGLCGSCTIRVNDKPVLACETIAEQTMLIEPVRKEKVVKDLVIIP